MKTSLVLFLCVVCNFAYTQNTMIENNFPTVDGKIFYSSVVNVDSLSKLEIYNKTKLWIVDNFKSADSVIQLDDTEAGVIVIRAFIEKGHNNGIRNPKNWFELKIEFKDGRYKYTLTNFIYEFDIYVENKLYQHHSYAFEDWMKPSDHKNEKKRNEIDVQLNNYCSELNSEFEKTIESLEKFVLKIEEQW